MKRCDCGCMELGKNPKAEQKREIQEAQGALQPEDQKQGKKAATRER